MTFLLDRLLAMNKQERAVWSANKAQRQRDFSPYGMGGKAHYIASAQRAVPMNDPDLVLDKFNRNQKTWVTVLENKQKVADTRKYEQGKMLGHYFNKEKAQRKAQRAEKEAKEYTHNEKQEKVVAVHKRRIQHDRDLAARKQRLYDSKHSPLKTMT